MALDEGCAVDALRKARIRWNEFDELHVARIDSLVADTQGIGLLRGESCLQREPLGQPEVHIPFECRHGAGKQTDPTKQKHTRTKPSDERGPWALWRGIRTTHGV
jgi:hypothetical protein